CRSATAIWRELGDRLREGENLSRLASQLVVGGRNAEAEGASSASLALLEALPPGPELAEAYRARAHLRMLDRDSAEAIRWGNKAIALAERFQRTDILSGAYNAVGSAMLVADDLDGRRYLERSGELARQAGLEAQVALAFVNLGSALGEFYHLALADQYLDAGIAYCAERDIDHHRLYMLAWQALCRMYSGRWSEATARAIQVWRHHSSATISRIMALVALGRVRARRGDPEVAAALDEALALAQQTGTLQRLAPVHAARAEAASLAGDRARIRAEAGAAFALAARHDHRWFTAELGYWLWRAGEEVDLSATPTNPFALQVAGDWAGAAAAWARLGCPYEAARALSEGDDEAALRRALVTFEQLGARPMAQAVARRLRERGARAIPRGPRPTTRANPVGLTGRELEILGLLAADLRNAEIAARLFVTPKTVEHHISAILAKLGVRSRAEAARVAAQRALLPQSGGDVTPK
ncbi:MAG TPA: LuxR C-terminal-related transcriptional regulator, partial [Thermomicrobiales bacterium]